MREPLQVFAIDSKMNRATGSIPYRSLRWIRRYKEPGEFELVVPADIYSPTWAYIYTDDRPEMGEIQKVEFNDSSEVYGGTDSVTLSGFFMEHVLNNIVFLVEAPEEQKNYVPEPRRPVFSHSKQDTKVYQDPMGDYYYENSSGDVVSADDGRVVSTNGLTEVDYRDAFGNFGGTSDSGICSYDYYTNSDHTQITTVPYHGDSHGQPGETYDIAFEDDKGNVFYRKDGKLTQAVGVVDSYGDTYQVKKRQWNALASDEWGHYYTVTVKGPWQRTDAMEPVTEGDSIDIVFKWARRMMGDWLLYEESDIDGIQKKVDPSFQYLGDLMYATLWEVGASLRLEYLFEKNIFILSVYRGLDRTQEDVYEPVQSNAVSLMSARAASYPVPEGYTALEYIQGTGSQYINTGFAPNQSTRVVIDHQMVNTSDTMGVFGARTNSSASDSFCVYAVEGKMRTDYGSEILATKEIVSSRTSIDKNGRVFIYDGSSYQNADSTFQTPVPLHIFSVKNVESGNNTDSNYVDTRCAKMRLYSCKVYDGGELVRDFIPAKLDSNGAIGLYDVKGSSFYTNAGSGVFVAGPEIDRPPTAVLTYEANDDSATGSTPSMGGYVGDLVQVAECGFSVSGKTFKTWSTEPGGGTEYRPGETYQLVDGTNVLYAQWTSQPTGGKAPWAVFSDTWGTISGYSASRDESNYKNTCYVLFDYDKPKSFDKNGWPQAGFMYKIGDYLALPTLYGIPYESHRGYNTEHVGDDDEPAIETYLDLRDEKPTCDGDWSRDIVEIPGVSGSEREQAIADAEEKFAPPEDAYDMSAVYDSYEASLAGRGEQHLKDEYPVITNLDTGAVNTDEYLKGFDLGDKVDFAVSTVGLAETGRIIEVEEDYESGKAEINITIGDELLSTIKKARLA